MLTFNCSSCQRELTFSDATPGMMVKCTHCGKIFSVPALADGNLTGQPADLSPDEVAERQSPKTGAASQEQQQPASTSTKQGMFSEASYVPFMVGAFTLGGFVALPLIYGGMIGLDYGSSLPWSLGSCSVFLIGFRRNGTISWWRAGPALFALLMAAEVYHKSTGNLRLELVASLVSSLSVFVAILALSLAGHSQEGSK